LLTSAFAQLPTGTILGTVKDATGAVVPDTAITVRNLETSQRRTGKTDSDGAYRFPALPVGRYSVQAEHAGFRSEIRQNLTLAISQEAVLDFALQIGTAEQEVVVGEARSPGMRHKHYAPKARMVVVEGSVPAIMVKVKELVTQYTREGSRVGVLATDETSSNYLAYVVKSLGSRFNVEAIAQNLFRLLREFDSENVDVIIAESVPAEGLGLAVMNRLRKASGYNIVKADKLP